jgi:hypothetical protein
MVPFGKTLQSGFVWLTALLTLVAGSPHVQCRCPNGRIKPFCLGFLFQGGATGGCCAADAPSSWSSCCAGPHAARTEKDIPSCCSCCSSAEERAESETCVHAAGCTRTLTGPVEFVAASGDAGGALALLGVAFLSPAAFAPIPSEDQGLPSWQGHSLAPPPTDLVTVLQRLTI